jgi:putative ABC transport system permease protein
MALDVEFIGRRSRLPVIDAIHGSADEAIAAIMSGGQVGVSENLARIRGFRVGDELPIVTPTGEWRPKIAMRVNDFTSEHGTVFVNRSEYVKLWGDDRANAFDLFLKPGADSHATTERLRAEFGPRYDLFITENAAFRQKVLSVVESVFTVTYAMEIVAIGVALLGVVTTLFAAILERTRELGVLRALGASRGHLRLAVMTEAFLIGAVASGFACTTGAVLGLVLVKKVIAGTYGYELDFVVPISSAVFGIVVATGLATIAGALPAARAAQIRIVEALAYQ